MLDQRQLEVRVGAGVAVTGKVLAAGGDPLALQRFDDHPPQTRDVFGALGQSAVADHRIARVRVDVEYRREIERDADRPELGGKRARESGRQLRVAAAPERQHRRPQGEWGLEACNATALLVHADPERQLACQRAGFPGQLRDLLGRLHVAGKEDHAAEIEVASEGSQLRWYGETVEARDRDLADMFADIPQRHQEIIAPSRQLPSFQLLELAAP